MCISYTYLKHSLKAKSGSPCLNRWCTNMVYAEHLPFCWKLGTGDMLGRGRRAAPVKTSVPESLRSVPGTGQITHILCCWGASCIVFGPRWGEEALGKGTWLPPETMPLIPWRMFPFAVIILSRDYNEKRAMTLCRHLSPAPLMALPFMALDMLYMKSPDGSSQRRSSLFSNSQHCSGPGADQHMPTIY